MALEDGDILGSSFNTASLLSAGDMITTIMFYVLIGSIVFGLLWFCIYLLSFKHKVRVYQETKGGVVEIDTKARQFKTKEGVVKWRFLKWMRDSHPAPQNDMLNLTSKGKLSAECVRSMSGHVTWVSRDISGARPPQLSGEEISMTANEMRRSEEYKKKNTLDKILTLAPIVMVVLILVLLFAFWGDLTAQTNVVASGNQAAATQLSEASISLSEKCFELTEAYYGLYPDLRPVGNNSFGGNYVGQVLNGGVPN